MRIFDLYTCILIQLYIFYIQKMNQEQLNFKPKEENKKSKNIQKQNKKYNYLQDFQKLKNNIKSSEQKINKSNENVDQFIKLIPQSYLNSPQNSKISQQSFPLSISKILSKQKNKDRHQKSWVRLLNQHFTPNLKFKMKRKQLLYLKWRLKKKSDLREIFQEITKIQQQKTRIYYDNVINLEKQKEFKKKQFLYLKWKLKKQLKLNLIYEQLLRQQQKRMRIYDGNMIFLDEQEEFQKIFESKMEIEKRKRQVIQVQSFKKLQGFSNKQWEFTMVI